MKDSIYRLPLDGQWQLAGRKQHGSADPAAAFPDPEFQFVAPVPGNIEDALCSAGIVPDPYFGGNSRELRKFEFYQWLYEFDFVYDGVERNLELVFEGVDLFGTVFLNGQVVGRAENAFLIHRFAVTPRKGRNHLAVHLASVPRELTKCPLNAGAFAGGVDFNAENLRFRRPGHESGWDIAPRMALGGLFRHVFLEEVPVHRFVETFLQTLSIAEDHGKASLRLMFHVDTPFLGDNEVILAVDGECSGARFHAERILWSAQGCLTFEVSHPKLWNPRHYGEAACYECSAKLLRGGEILAEKKFLFGIRTLALAMQDTVTDAPDPDFQLSVNGMPVRCIGMNHVPADALHSHDEARLGTILDSARALDCNILRVWGGGIYEPNSFYERCDREGILVWQDFMMACAQYPNDESFLRTIEAEAEEVVKRLRQHPSIALWCGDNECDMVPSWSGQFRDPNENLLTRKILPEVLHRHDPARPYVPSSPYFSPAAVAKGPDPSIHAPEQHLWGDRGYFKNDFYANSTASFVSETGYYGSPDLASLLRFLPEESVHSLDDEACFMHGTNANYPYDLTNNYRVKGMKKQIGFYFSEVPDSPEDFVAASQIVQAEAMKFLTENYRTKRKCSGLILWNLADCWPQFSEALLDYYHRPKLAFFYLKNCFHSVFFAENEAGEIWGVNDSPAEMSGKLRITGESGTELFCKDFVLPANQPCLVGQLATPEAAKAKVHLLEWHLKNDVRGKNHYVNGTAVYNYGAYRREILSRITEFYQWNLESVQ
ncbi:MAG: hypothetical protein PHS41_04860 [Victivallaceae bacterium]|nr:hypothetical protein [Victivallaceae bacterium]